MRIIRRAAREDDRQLLGCHAPKVETINGLKILSTAKINVLNIIPKKIALNERY